MRPPYGAKFYQPPAERKISSTRRNWRVCCYGGPPRGDQWSFYDEPFDKGERILHLIDVKHFRSMEAAVNGASYQRGYFPFSNPNLVVVLMYGRTPKRIVQYQLSEDE